MLREEIDVFELFVPGGLTLRVFWGIECRLTETYESRPHLLARR